MYSNYSISIALLRMRWAHYGKRDVNGRKEDLKKTIKALKESNDMSHGIVHDVTLIDPNDTEGTMANMQVRRGRRRGITYY